MNPTLARNAVRLAAGDGLLVIQERRRPGCPNLPNVLRILSREWKSWIAKWGRPPAYTFLNPTKSVKEREGKSERLRRVISVRQGTQGRGQTDQGSAMRLIGGADQG